VAKVKLSIEIRRERAPLAPRWETTISVDEGLSKPVLIKVVGLKSESVKDAFDDLVEYVTKEIGARDLDTADADPILVVDALVRGLRGYEE